MYYFTGFMSGETTAMPVFDKEGKEVLDAAEILSPEELNALITGSGKYQKALGEAIERRKELKELRSQLVQHQEAANAEPEKSEKPEIKPAAKSVDEDALIEKALQRFKTEQQAVHARDALVKKVMKENNLPLDNDKFRDAVAIAPDEETMKLLAAALAQATMKVDNSTAGGNGETVELDANAIFASLDKKLFKEKSGTK
jgi:hypothetical protein